MAVQKGQALTTLVLGVSELVCGILIIILSVVAANKADVGAGLAVWWAGLIVSLYLNFVVLFVSILNC